MIINSMSRNSSSFRQLLSYLDKDEAQDKFNWNMYSDCQNSKELVKEFMENAEYLRESRGKNYLYHEVISLQEKNLDLKKSSEILRDLANKYVSQRAMNQMVYGVIHSDTKNPHIHLVISSNQIASGKRTRLSKTEFSHIQSKLELYKNTRYSDLERTARYQSSKDIQKATQKEQEIKHKRKTSTTKDLIKSDLSELFSKATSHTYLNNVLSSKGYEIYERGKNTGVTYQGKNYRFNTLGLDSDYKQALTKISSIEKRQEKRSEYKQSR